jgi:hypothetical protein
LQSNVTMSATILITLSKLTFLPRKALVWNRRICSWGCWQNQWPDHARSNTFGNLLRARPCSEQHFREFIHWTQRPVSKCAN